MVSKSLLLGLGLIGGAIFILPTLSGGGKTQTFSGGSGGIPSVAMIGFPSGVGGVESSADTKKEKEVVYRDRLPDVNIYESELPSSQEVFADTPSTPTKKESSTVQAGTMEIGETVTFGQDEEYGITRVTPSPPKTTPLIQQLGMTGLISPRRTAGSYSTKTTFFGKVASILSGGLF